MNIHPIAQEGFSSGAQSYTSGRPEYPTAILSWLIDVLGINHGKTVVDLGAGTGKFAVLLSQTKAEVIAVEPVDKMREQLSNQLKNVLALAGTAEAIPLETSSVDAVLCATAFHWFATEAALTEIHRVLKPEGKLGLVWNVRDESVDWVSAITEITTPYEGNAPRFNKEDWRKPFSGKLFTKLEQVSFEYHHIGSPQKVIIDRILSVSFIAALPSHEKTKIIERLNRLIDSHPVLHAQDKIAFPYRTMAYWCSRLNL